MNDKDKKTMMRICGLFSSIPYSGGCGLQFEGEDTTLEMIAGNLEKLRDTLKNHSECEREKDKELNEYREAAHGVAFLFRKVGEMSAKIGEPGKKMYNFELELAGFDGDTDETDHLIKWISAPSYRAVQRFVERARLPLTKAGIIEMNNQGTLTRADGIDVILTEDGCMLTSGDIDRVCKWTEESDKVTKQQS